MNEVEVAFLEELGNEAARTMRKVFEIADHHFRYRS